MNSRIQLLLSSVVFLSLAAVGIGTYKARAYRHAEPKIAGQGQERIVVDKSRSDTPVKISLVRTKKRIVENNKRILDDDDWLEGLRVQIVNRSDKTVTFVGILLMFERTEDQESGLPAGWPLHYGFDPFSLNPADSVPSPVVAPILPGSDTEIVLSETEYNEVKRFLAEAGFPASRKRIELDIIKIGFSDGTAWNNGLMFRRDPSSLRGPLKGWSPLDDPSGRKLQTHRPSGSAHNRTAFFMKGAFKSYNRSEWLFSTVFQSTAVAQTVPCGTVVYETVNCYNAGAGLDCRNDQADLVYNPISQLEATKPFAAPCTAVYNGVTFHPQPHADSLWTAVRYVRSIRRLLQWACL